ncbi:NUDIX domain-containing protein [Pontibacter ruber]|uniref:GDP-mannose pyrophosphatase n=1 Tax=Pontibacter ruber TaxID=1343895 RepID=A0ABW5CY35_9BACT|nr:NUDIX hydrolase [Pontibacter ruber]
MTIKKIKTIYDGFYTLRKLVVEENGEIFEREQFESGDGAAALVYDTQKEKYILVKQYRYPARQELLEVVAGVLEDNDPEKTIRKEIEEETGYTVDSLQHIRDIYTSPGACTEKIYMYYAEVSRQKGKGGGLDEENENVKIVYLTQEELLQKELLDAKTIIAVHWLSKKLNQPPKDTEATL